MKRNRLAFAAVAISSILFYSGHASAKAVMQIASTSPVGLSVLEANLIKYQSGKFIDTCNDETHPTVYLITQDWAIAIVPDETGVCSGDQPPSDIFIDKQVDGIWKLDTSTTGNGFKLGNIYAVMPDIIVEYPGYQTDCPIFKWDISKSIYDYTAPCNQ